MAFLSLFVKLAKEIIIFVRKMPITRYMMKRKKTPPIWDDGELCLETLFKEEPTPAISSSSQSTAAPLPRLKKNNATLAGSVPMVFVSLYRSLMIKSPTSQLFRLHAQQRFLSPMITSTLIPHKLHIPFTQQRYDMINYIFNYAANQAIPRPFFKFNDSQTSSLIAQSYDRTKSNNQPPILTLFQRLSQDAILRKMRLSLLR